MINSRWPYCSSSHFWRARENVWFDEPREGDVLVWISPLPLQESWIFTSFSDPCRRRSFSSTRKWLADHTFHRAWAKQTPTGTPQLLFWGDLSLLLSCVDFGRWASTSVAGATRTWTSWRKWYMAMRLPRYVVSDAREIGVQRTVRLPRNRSLWTPCGQTSITWTR